MSLAGISAAAESKCVRRELAWGASTAAESKHVRRDRNFRLIIPDLIAFTIIVRDSLVLSC